MNLYIWNGGYAFVGFCCNVVQDGHRKSKPNLNLTINKVTIFTSDMYESNRALDNDELTVFTFVKTNP